MKYRYLLICLFATVSCSYRSSKPADNNIFSEDGHIKKAYTAKQLRQELGWSIILFWNYTKDSLRYELEDGPIIRFVDSYYRFPDNLKELFQFDCLALHPYYSKSELRRIYRKMSYTKYGEDSCEIKGGFYGNRVTSVLYNTPLSSWSKIYTNDERNSWDRITEMATLSAHYHPSFFDRKGVYIFDSKSEEIFSNRIYSLLERKYDVLKVKTANDTIPLYLFFKFSEEDGLSSIGYYPSPESLLLNQEPLQDKDCLSVCSDLINELGDLCYDYCGDNIGSVIFQSPMVVFRN